MVDSKQEILKAWKNGVCQRFTRHQWEIMGSDKYGWVLEPEVPKEVRGAGVVTTHTFKSGDVVTTTLTTGTKTRATRKSKQQ